MALGPALRQTASVSFEYFPPHSPEANIRLWRSVERLAPLGPKFVSVTYGAGGTTRERTRSAILTIRDRARLAIAGHLTCVGASRDETMAVARDYASIGAMSVVALRGDPAKGEGKFTPHPEGFTSAAELVTALADNGTQNIYVAAYPEIHPDAESAQADLDNLKRKIDAGATAAITQFFFSNEVFLRFRDQADAAGINVPIYPGILPIENFGKMVNFAGRCSTEVPDWMHAAFANAKSEEDQTLLSTAIATEQCDELLAEGASHLHFYTLNNPDLTFNICHALGYAPKALSVTAGSVA